MSNLFVGLNENQLRAVTSTAPVILCIAGAGSGKTTVLTRRVANLVNQGIKTTHILCLTFTRLAGMEMKERVIKLIGDEPAKDLFSNTFHAFAVSVLKEFGHLLGIDENFTIYDQDDRNEILVKIIDEFGKRTTLSKVTDRYENCRDYRDERRLYPEECRILEEYGYRCKQNNAVDLNRLIDLVIRLWELNPNVLAVYQNRYSHVFVDEFQDTNEEQAYMVDMLKARNLFIVGDADQSIYEWRGAKVEYIVNFEKNNPSCEVIKLEDNYRSTEQIVEAANRLIKNNVKRVDKKLIAHKTGCKIELNNYVDANVENAAVATLIAALISSNGLPYKEVAILSRTNAKLDSIKRELLARQIPCIRVSGADDPYKTTYVRPIMDWLYFLQNKKDNVAFKKVYKTFKVSTLEMLEIELNASSSDVSLYQASLSNGKDEFFETMGKIELLIADNSALAHFSAARLILYYSEQHSDVTTAFNAIEKWQASRQRVGEDTSIKSFLKYLRYRDIQEKLTEEADAVKLMTIHGSKGLEFDTVFLVGMNQDVFPSKRGEIEEERRLAYVAVTRAKTRLCVSWPEASPNWGGKLVTMLPSQFISEMGLSVCPGANVAIES